MNFDDTINAIAALEGELVDVLTFGRDKSAPSLTSMTGFLERVLPPDELPPELEHAVQETAVVFRLDERNTNLWPTRFVTTNRLPYKQGFEVVTSDAVIRVRKYEPPWS